MAKSDLYKQAGVDIDLAQKLLERVKKSIASTRRPEMLAPIGGFGGLFQIDLSKYRQPVMVSSIDGVGTKLMVAMKMESYSSVGHDIVNHCVNDIAVQGAEPVYFMDYIGIGVLRSPLYEEVLCGIADACREVNCAVLGGETAEMPGMYGNDFDLVGVITGMVEKDKIITGEKIRPGYKAIGLRSVGLHTNGFSLARKIVFDICKLDVHDTVPELGESVGAALVKPHLCYWNAIKAALASGINLDGIAHITGGGLYDNVPRILPGDVDVIFDSAKIVNPPPIFKFLTERGGVSHEEAYRVFNMGVGMVWFVPAEETAAALKLIADRGFIGFELGDVVAGSGKVEVL